jgi:hypothetical protein
MHSAKLLNIGWEVGLAKRSCAAVEAGQELAARGVTSPWVGAEITDDQ